MSSTPDASQFTFFHTLRVRWAEVDPQSIVFNGHYLTYADVAITEYFRALASPTRPIWHRMAATSSPSVRCSSTGHRRASTICCRSASAAHAWAAPA